MRLSGLHLLLTYKCNSECAHCFLSCGPHHDSFISFSDAKKYVDEAKDVPGINYFFIEGGEPFLDSELARKIIQHTTDNGYWIGILGNGYWAKTVEKGKEILRPLKEAGLGAIGISTDRYHQEKVPLATALNAVQAAKELEIDVDIMVTSDDKSEGDEIKSSLRVRNLDVPVSISKVRGKGRGSLICSGKARPWQELSDCNEALKDPGRVHIGPEGAIHLCQGVLIGQDARKKQMKEIFEEHLKAPNVIVEQIAQGGPAKLAEFAIKYGFKPKDTYLQDCQLCFEVRKFLRDNYPEILGPKEVYDIDSRSK